MTHREEEEQLPGHSLRGERARREAASALDPEPRGQRALPTHVTRVRPTLTPA
jgi:hypothetical protein